MKKGGSSRPGGLTEVFIPEVTEKDGALPPGVVGSHFSRLTTMYGAEGINALIPKLGPKGKSFLCATKARHEPMPNKALNKVLRILFSAIVNGENARGMGSTKILRQAGPSIASAFGLRLVERLPFGDGWAVH